MWQLEDKNPSKYEELKDSLMTELVDMHKEFYEIYMFKQVMSSLAIVFLFLLPKWPEMYRENMEERRKQKELENKAREAEFLENPILDNMIWFLVFATMCLILFTIKFIFY